MNNTLSYLWGKFLQMIGRIDLAAKIADQFPAPEKIGNKTIYVIGPPGRPKWITMRCPCGCSEQITLSLMKGHSPSWDFAMNKSRITLSPSVWKTDGCRSHFFIRKSKIIWAKTGI